jgi:site-specific DNA recombinase
MSAATVAIYARVSSDRQAREHTIASQVAALRERVAQDGFVLDENLSFLDEGRSGAVLDRPALERLRDSAAAGLFDRLYVLAPDRLSRKPGHLIILIEEMKRYGVEIVFLNRPIAATAEDDLLVQIQGVIAEYERAKIQERSRRGKRYAAQRGVVSVFSGAPYGYRYVPKSPTSVASYEMDAAETAVVRQMFAWVADERCSIREVCRRLKKQRILTRTGLRDWEPATVSGILRNPAYHGQAAFGKTRMGERRGRLRPQRGRPESPRRPSVSWPRPADEWIAIAVPALLSAEVFEAVAEQLRENRRRCRVRAGGAGHLLQGLLVCQHCRYACYGQSTKNQKNERVHGYYRCIGTDRRHGERQRRCAMPTVSMADLDAAVWNDVRALLADPSRVRAEYERRRSEPNATEPERREWESRRRRVQSGLDRLINAFAEGLIDKPEFEPRVRQAKQRLKELDAEGKLLKQRATRDEQAQEVIHRLEQFAAHVRTGLDRADRKTQRELVRALVKRVELSRDDVRIVYRVDLCPFEPGPKRGQLRHCVRCRVPALRKSTYCCVIDALKTLAICSFVSSRCARAVSSGGDFLSASARSIRLLTSLRCMRARLRASGTVPRKTSRESSATYARCRLRRIMLDLSVVGLSAAVGKSTNAESVTARMTSATVRQPSLSALALRS